MTTKERAENNQAGRSPLESGGKQRSSPDCQIAASSFSFTFATLYTLWSYNNCRLPVFHHRLYSVCWLFVCTWLNDKLSSITISNALL